MSGVWEAFGIERTELPPGERPCHTAWSWRFLNEFCDECAHVLVAHVSDHTCSVCKALRRLLSD